MDVSVPFDQQHDESVEKPNVPPRGMHGQSVTSSSPYDERAQHAHEKVIVEATTETVKVETTRQRDNSVNKPKPGPLPRGMHGESVLRSTPYDERYAKAAMQRTAEPEQTSSATNNNPQDDSGVMIPPTVQGEMVTEDGVATEEPANDAPSVPASPPAPKPEGDSPVQTECVGMGKKAAAKVNNFVGATVGKVKDLVKK